MMQDTAVAMHDESPPAANHSRVLIELVGTRIGLLLAVVLVFGQVFGFEFPIDDHEYVWANPTVQSGLTPESVSAAFTNVVVGTWVPATMLSHQAVTQLFGMHSGFHHWTNVVLHLLAALLLFACLRRATGCEYNSFFVAGCLPFIRCRWNRWPGLRSARTCFMGSSGSLRCMRISVTRSRLERRVMRW